MEAKLRPKQLNVDLCSSQQSHLVAASTICPAAIVFSADLTLRLSTKEMRLPPTYVGVRRVRPSSLVVN
jgi:hypothetical protein